MQVTYNSYKYSRCGWQVGDRLEAELEQVKAAEQKQEGARANAATREERRKLYTQRKQMGVVFAVLTGEFTVSSISC